MRMDGCVFVRVLPLLPRSSRDRIAQESWMTRQRPSNARLLLAACLQIQFDSIHLTRHTTTHAFRQGGIGACQPAGRPHPSIGPSIDPILQSRRQQHARAHTIQEQQHQSKQGVDWEKMWGQAGKWLQDRAQEVAAKAQEVAAKAEEVGLEFVCDVVGWMCFGWVGGRSGCMN